MDISRTGGLTMRTPKACGQPCPNPDCAYAQMINRGNIRAISTYLTQSGKRRIFQCTTCGTPFSETRDSVFFDLKTPEEKVMMALKMLLVKVDLAGISFVLGVTEETVLAWLQRAALKAAEINAHLLRDLPVTQVQLDEMWNFIARKHACETDTAGESLPDSEDGRQWVWISFAPEFRLMIAAVVGPRTLDTAKEVVAATKARVAGIPAFFSDGFTCSLAALIAAFHVVTTCARTGKRGRPRKPIRIKLSIDSFRKHDGFVVLTYTLLQYLRGGPSFSRGLGRQTFGGGTDVGEKAA